MTFGITIETDMRLLGEGLVRDGSSVKKVREKLAVFCIVYHEKVAIVKNEKNIIIKIKIRMQS